MPIRRDNKGRRIVKGARAGPTFEWEGLQVREDRGALLYLLLEAAGRLPNCAREQGRERLTCLGEATKLRTTLIRWLIEPIVPDWGPLCRVADQTEMPLPRFLVVLNITDEAELAAALNQQAPQLVLSDEERQWLALIRSWSAEERRRQYDYLAWEPPRHQAPDQT